MIYRVVIQKIPEYDGLAIGTCRNTEEKMSRQILCIR